MIFPARRAWALLPLRLVVGFGFAAHGYAKLARGLDSFAAILQVLGIPAPGLVAWATSLLELIGGVCLMLGALVLPLSLPLAVVMLTALFGVHLRYGFSSIRLQALSATGAVFGPVGYELNLLYLAALLVLALCGPGPLSVDRWLWPRKGERPSRTRPWSMGSTSSPTPDDVQYLEDRIYEFNSRATGITDGDWLAIFVRDDIGRIVAGICGNTWGGTCEIRQLWVEESGRHRGTGTELLRAAEREARRRGCTQIVLMTFSFQAPLFYERHGFEVVATVEDHPRGYGNHLMRKRLTT